MQTLSAILRLTRLDSSLLSFLAVFIPFLVRTNDLGLSFRRAIPLLFTGVCTFIANDLDDIERDQVNHPERPLPARQITPTLAAILYFISLAAALFSTKHFVPPGIAFLYYALIALAISYGHIVESLPGLKTPYVAAASSIPVLIVATSYPGEARLFLVAVSAFLFTMGREICMDIRDRAGDAISFMNRLRPKPLAIASFYMQALGLLVLAVQAHKAGDVVALLAITSLLVLSGVYWFSFTSYRRATILMKLQFFVGLYFLI